MPYDAPQAVKEDGNGGISLTLAISPDAPANATKLAGVLTSDTGWRPDGSLPGLQIDIPFKTGQASMLPPPGAAGAAKPSP